MFGLETAKWEGMCIERGLPKTMNEKGKDDPVLHIMEEIRYIVNQILKSAFYRKCNLLLEQNIVR